MATFAGASDAVAAAVAIQQAVDRLNRSGKASVPLAVRVGLSAGDVSFEDDDVHGTPVIEASRLCGAAVGGEILASEIVRWLGGAQGALSLPPVGSLELKGLAAPVPAVRIEWEPAPASTIPMPALLTDVGRIFVGRDVELERLGRLWKEAAAGERRVALLAGEPGVGKTRLAAELAISVHNEGGVVLAGRCDEDLGVPYQPFVEALRHFVDHTPGPELRERLGRYGGELTRLVPELGERIADLPASLRSDPETERYRLFDAVSAWLIAASSEEPLLLLVDDLQWAAKPTLLMLRHIVRVPELRRVMILGTYRDTELDHGHPLVDVLADLRREAGVERASLGGFDTSAVGAFMEQAAGHPMSGGDLVLAGAIHEETQGNPFFVREVLRHLAETGAIERERGRWGARLPVEELGIPDSVREVVGRRLARLSEPGNQALRVAAVTGPEFELAVVQIAGRFDEESMLSGLEEAAQSRLIIETAPAQRYRFAHALVRDTLYGNLSAARRVSLHRQVAEAIEELHADHLDDYLPGLAHHWARASAPAADTARAVDYARRAGDRALTQLAPDEAMAYYRQALELLDAAEPAEEQRLRLLIALGEAQRQAGDPAHRETLLSAARLATERGDADALARAALANTRGFYPSAVGEVDDDRVACLHAALEAIRDDDAPTRARLLAALGTELVYAGDLERRMRLADEALAIARHAGDDATLAHVLLQNYFPMLTPNTLEKRLAYTEELVPLAQSVGDPVIVAWALLLRFRALTESRNVDAADPYLDQAERLAEELAQPTLRFLVGCFRTTRIILAGDLAEGERRAKAGFELGRATGQRDALSILAIQLFVVHFEQGRLGELEERLAERVAATPGLPVLRALLALLLCELDRPDEATLHYERLAAENFAGMPLNPAWIHATAACAGVCASLGDRGRAPVLFHLLEPYASQLALTPAGALGAVAHFLAILAATVGDFDEAQRRFADAAATHERIGAPTWLARTRLEWARMLLTRREPGDAERARELLGRSLETARELGLANVERRAIELLA
jgi:tetratricopeptide (TPR) repeat protein